MNIKKMTQASVFRLVATFIIVFTATAIGQVDYEVVGFECIAYLDGHFEDRVLVREGREGEVRSIRPSELRKLSPAAWESLVVTQSVAWPKGTNTIEFNMTTLAAEHQKDFAKAIKKYVNKKRGSGNVPKAVLTNEVVSYAAPAEFDLSTTDGMNTLVMTADDRHIGQGVGAFFRVWRSAPGGQIQNGFVDTQWQIIEADGFFRANLFDMDPFFTYLFIVHEFGHGFGHQHSLFSEDYMSYNPDLVTLKNLKKKNDLSKERDKLYYDENYRKSPRMWCGDVLDLGYGTAPNGNDEDLDQNSHHPSVITTLKGFPGSPMEMNIYEGNKTKNKNKIASLSGATIEYTQQGQGNFQYRFAYELSLLNIGDSSAYNALLSKLNQKGKAMKINGVNYSKALQITIEVKGTMTDGGPTQTVKKTLFMVNSGPGGQ